MPSFVITCRGGLLLKAGLRPTGSTIEMSEKDAASLPSGTVSRVPEKPLLLVAPPPVAPVVPTGIKPTPFTGARRAKDSKP